MSPEKRVVSNKMTSAWGKCVLIALCLGMLAGCISRSSSQVPVQTLKQQVVVNKILDVQGLPCPTPTVMTGNTLRDMKKGLTLQVITSDMTTKQSITSLCVQEGYELLELKEEDGLICFIVKK